MSSAPDLLIVWMARNVDREQLPPNRTVVQFDFRDPAKRYWMVLEPSEASVCIQHPGFDVDLEVKVDTATLYRVYLGARRVGRRDPRTPADSERPEGAPARVLTLVCLGARSHPQAAGLTSAAGRRRDSRGPRGCGSNSLRSERPAPAP